MFDIISLTNERGFGMNKEYTCVDEKVLIKDEKGCNRVVPYQDNIEEILISENVILELENKLIQTNKDKKDYEKRNSRPKWLRALINMCPFLIGVVLPISIGPIANNIFNVAPDIMSVIERMVTITTFFTFIPTTVTTVGNFLEDKYAYKHERAINAQIGMLNKSLEEEKEHLEELKQSNTKTIKRDVQTKKIEDEEAKKNVDMFCDLYYDCGYNIEHYYNYYLKTGELPHKLQRNYNKLGHERCMEFIEEKGPSLIKSKNLK